MLLLLELYKVHLQLYECHGVQSVEVLSSTMYVTVQLVEHSLILHLMLTAVLVESMALLPYSVHLAEEHSTTSGWQLCHQVDEDHTVTGDSRELMTVSEISKVFVSCM